MTTDFKYLPLSGPISGQSVLRQTEIAFNELGANIDQNTEIARQSLEKSEQAITTSNNAIVTSNEALSTATNADQRSQQALSHSNEALSNSVDAKENAHQATTTANAAHAQADIALNTANEAIGHIDDLKTDIDAVSSNLGNLTNIVNDKLIYQPVSSVDDINDYFIFSENFFIENSETLNLPVAEKGYLTIRTDKENELAHQCYFTENGTLFVRAATVIENTEFENPDDRYSVTWTRWEGLATLTQLATKQDTLTFDALPTAGSSNPVTSAGVKSAIDSAISTVYKWKGSVDSVSSLPASGNAVGDVYNVVSSGANYGWTGETWDNLGGIDAVDAVPVKDSAYPVASGGVFDKLALKQDRLVIDAYPVADSPHMLTSGTIFNALASKQNRLVIDDFPVADSPHMLTSGTIFNALASKQDRLVIDALPIADSPHMLTSGTIFNALASKQDKLVIDDTPTASSSNPVSSGGVAEALAKIQDSLIFDDTPTAGSTNPVTSQGIKTALDQLAVNGAGAPVGTIQYFAMDIPPAGYLKADGSLVSRSVYADLFAAVGTTYGAGDGSTTFALPDLRGEFVRGFDDGRGVDNARVFGSAQTDAQYPLSDQPLTQLERFPATDQPATASTGDAKTFGYRMEPSSQASAPEISICGYAPEEGDSIAIMDLVPFNQQNTADEVRPRNVALLACIKAFGVVDNTGSVDLTTLASKDEVAKKQDKLTFDTAPTANSSNPVTSGGVANALSGVQPKLTFDSAPTAGSTHPVTSGGVYSAIQNGINGIDLSGYWNTRASGSGVVDHSFLQADAQSVSGKTVTITKQSAKSLNLTTSGAVTLDIQPGNETDTAFITLNFYAEAATSLTWPASVIWIDSDAQAPAWGSAGGILHVQLCLARTRILASTLYNSEK